MDSHVPSDDRSGFWTNEKHGNFLNRMEASFVRTMLQNDGRSMLTYATGQHAPLDRSLPDSSESTRDLQHRKNRRKTPHVYFPEVTNDTRNEERKTMRRSSRQQDCSQDQVVPQLGSMKADKDGESDKLKEAVAPNN